MRVQGHSLVLHHFLLEVGQSYPHLYLCHHPITKLSNHCNEFVRESVLDGSALDNISIKFLCWWHQMRKINEDTMEVSIMLSALCHATKIVSLVPVPHLKPHSLSCGHFSVMWQVKWLSVILARIMPAITTKKICNNCHIWSDLSFFLGTWTLKVTGTHGSKSFLKIIKYVNRTRE